MKKIFILLAVLISMGGVVIADDPVTLIDFTKLTADFPEGTTDGANQRTMIDFRRGAGASISDADRELLKISLELNDWEVELASSSKTVENMISSYTKSVPVTGGKYEGETVLGIRVHFPDASYNSYAIVRPPFEIPAYMDLDQIDADGNLEVPAENIGKGAKFDGYGVVKNVGVLKSVSIIVRGLNFPNGLGLILLDEYGREKNIFMRYLNFNGWKELTWKNPNYITDVRNRELVKLPIYPKSAPLVKLGGIVIYKDAAQEGDDFITYIRDIKVTFDKARLDVEKAIDDENVWGILQKREESRRNAELERLGELQVLRYLEDQKMFADPDQNEFSVEDGAVN